ncbi:MAG: WD40 repeat domain-containing protein [Gemmataceae bacterium]
MAITAVHKRQLMRDGRLYIYDTGSNRLIQTLDQPSRVSTIAFLGRGDRLLTAGWDDGLRIFSGSPLAEVASFPNDPSRSTAFWLAATPDGKRVAAGSSSGMPRLWDVDAKKATPLPKSTVLLGGIALSPDGKNLAVAFMAPRIEVYDTITAMRADVFDSEGGAYTSVRYSPDGRVLAAGILNDGGERQLHIWDCEAKRIRHVCAAGSVSDVRQLAFTPDSKYVVTMTVDDRKAATGGRNPVRRIELLVWSVVTGDLAQRVGLDDAGGTEFALSPTGNALVTIGDDGSVRKWDFTRLRADLQRRKE